MHDKDYLHFMCAKAESAKFREGGMSSMSEVRPAKPSRSPGFTVLWCSHRAAVHLGSPMSCPLRPTWFNSTHHAFSATWRLHVRADCIVRADMSPNVGQVGDDASVHETAISSHSVDAVLAAAGCVLRAVDQVRLSSKASRTRQNPARVMFDRIQVASLVALVVGAVACGPRSRATAGCGARVRK